MWQNPKALVTTKPGKGRKCINEILNRILIKDIDARVIEYVQNVAIVYSNLDSLVVYGLLFASPPSCAEKVYPFQLIINSTNEKEIVVNVINFIKNKTKDLKTFYVRCYNRGIDVNCREIEMGVGIGLKGLINVDFKDPEVVLHVNVLKEFAGISLLRKNQEKFRATLLDKI
ncbi:RNA methyltransferase [Saccharolobus solfataricus]|nr:THUMP domain-containing protein [Saccharolobus solfataricus]AKA74092.1 RNA methyltransferase [Saccharolobus solfataricus]AKA76790.1 RNA methyltransferase [Saccharolobus solfataricus]AKA79483.1 RNA methyltransferase [Saccharolobus solfataricus]AZF68571.1 RNA methyltransferase [Saccharolobus solfataricus]AZF71191.1 RNA methyltransferase [Saccharolobus solfataricus]